MGFNERRIAHGTLALVLTASATAVFAQTPSNQPPPPPPPDTTTVVEKPDAVPPPPEDQPPAEPVTPAPTKPNAPEQKTEHVPQDASGFHLSTLETKNLSLLYIDPVQTYLTPYLGRAFENALAFHMKEFHWKPWERTTILVKDFSDYGNAAALGSPSNMVLLDVAPLSLSMETFSPGERFFTLNNHELAHVAAIDVWNRRDAFWRHFLGGKPVPLQKHPESILYNFLTSPRNLTPRWYMEGSAVFFETWMAGGLGRAQGGYDEMVFRAKVRDGTRIYSPLGLESEVDRKTQDEVKLWHQTLRAYRSQQWDQVEVNLINLQRIHADCELYQLYAERVANFRRTPPPAGWEGVTTFDEK